VRASAGPAAFGVLSHELRKTTRGTFDGRSLPWRPPTCPDERDTMLDLTKLIAAAARLISWADACAAEGSEPVPAGIVALARDGLSQLGARPAAVIAAQTRLFDTGECRAILSLLDDKASRIRRRRTQKRAAGTLYRPKAGCRDAGAFVLRRIAKTRETVSAILAELERESDATRNNET